MNLCADCANACGGCSWSALDPRTNKPMFKPVEGWDAEYVERDYHLIDSGSYDVVSCPQFVPDPPRKKIELPKYNGRDSDRQIAALARYANAERVLYNEKKYAERLARKNKRYAAGLCVRCGKRPRRVGFTECEVCTAKKAAERKRRKERDAL